MADISVKLPAVSKKEDIDAVVSIALDTADGATERHEAIELLRRSDYPDLTSLLVRILHSPGERELFRSWATQHLGINAQRAQDERAIAALHEAVDDRHTLVRREALLGLSRLNDPVGIDTAVLWLKEKRPGVLDLCIRIIREHSMREHLPLLRSLISDPSEAVSRQAMVTAGEWNDQESRPAISALLHSDKPLIRSAAEAAIRRLDTGLTNEQPLSKEGVEPKNTSRF